MRVLVTGATGYIGGRLVPELLARGVAVRVLARDASRIAGRSWAADVEVFEGDLLAAETLSGLCDDVDAAYYLVHSMYGGDDFRARDAAAANNFAAVARVVPHVIYLGGLLPDAADVSEHLRSRAETGELLGAALPVTEFRAGPIIGSGSASFEMIRYLTERLPAMVAPRWILNDVQPVAIHDVLAYLVSALDHEPLGIVDIGADRLSFEQTMLVYADVRGLSRTIVPLPVLAPKLAALWVGLVTPIPNTIAVPLISGVIHSVTADTRRAHEIFPAIEPVPFRRALELALEETTNPSRWSDAAGPNDHTDEYRVTDWEGTIQEVRTIHIAAPPPAVYATVSSLGGAVGWLAWDWAWEMRGLLDRLFGGPGVRRGRRHPTELIAGDAVDFWRVESAVPAELLLLRAEMLVPGAAWLEWAMTPEGDGTRLVQTARFAPHGLAGALYWYALYPVHKPIFSALVKAIAERAEVEERKHETQQHH